MKRLLATRKRKIIALTLALMLVAGVAFAAWLASGAGDMAAKVGSELQSLTVGSAAVTTEMFPGGNGSVDGTVFNPNSAALTLVSVTFSSITPVSAPGCPATAFTTTNASGLSIPLPPGVTTTVSFPNAISMASSAPSECAGKSLAIFATVSARTS